MSRSTVRYEPRQEPPAVYHRGKHRLRRRLCPARRPETSSSQAHPTPPSRSSRLDIAEITIGGIGSLTSESGVRWPPRRHGTYPPPQWPSLYTQITMSACTYILPSTVLEAFGGCGHASRHWRATALTGFRRDHKCRHGCRLSGSLSVTMVSLTLSTPSSILPVPRSSANNPLSRRRAASPARAQLPTLGRYERPAAAGRARIRADLLGSARVGARSDDGPCRRCRIDHQWHE